VRIKTATENLFIGLSTLLLFVFLVVLTADAAASLQEIDERIAAGRLLIHLDEVDSYIDHPDRCGTQSAQLRKLSTKLARLNEKKRQRQISYAEYSAKFDRIKPQQRSAKRRFDNCFSSQLKRLLQKYPDIAELGIDSWTGLNEEYKRLRNRYFVAGFSRRTLDRLIEQRAALYRDNARHVGVLAQVNGSVRVESFPLGDVIEGNRGDSVHLGDVIITGPRARARVHFLESYAKAATAVLNIGSDTMLRIDFFDPAEAEEGVKLNLIQGWFRALLRGAESMLERHFPKRFSVRTSSVLCSTQGGEFEVNHDPVTRRTAYKVHEGAIHLLTPRQEVEINAGGAAAVSNGVISRTGSEAASPPL